MGNKCGKPTGPSESLQSAHPMLTTDEYECLLKLYRFSHKHKSVRSGGSPTKDRLKDVWKNSADEYVLKIYYNYLHKSEEMITDEFINFFCSLTKSYCEESAAFVLDVMRFSEDNVTYDSLLLYVTNLTLSYFKALKHFKDKVFDHWNKLGIENSPEIYGSYAEFLCYGLQDKDVDEESFRQWYCLCSQFQKLQSAFAYKLFSVPMPSVTYKRQMIEKHLLPTPIVPVTMQTGVSFSILDITDVLFLNSVLPDSSRFEWELCFSTMLHGQGFGKLVRLISRRGPTVVIIQERNGNVFGGYASASWATGANFHGDSESFLFKLRPVMQVYEPTGYNNHYQYVNFQQQTLPNGLGMGGQFGYFGFWLDVDFQGHSSESCTTYKNYKMLSSSKNFSIDHVEVWAVTVPDIEEEDDDEGGTKTILDKDSGAKALLEIAGKPMVSEGYRDKPADPL